MHSIFKSVFRSQPEAKLRAQAGRRRGPARPVLVLLVALALMPAISVLHVEAQEGGWQVPAGSIVHSAAVSADGQAIAVGTRSGLVIRLNASGQELWRYDTKGTVLGLALTADGSRVLAATESRSAFMLDAAGQVVWQKDVDHVIQSAAMSGDGSLIALAMVRNKEVMALDGAGNELWTSRFDSAANALAISADGRWIVLGTRDANVRFLDLQGNEVSRLKLDGAINGIAASQDGAFVAAADASQKVFLVRVDVSNQPRGSVAWSQPIGGAGEAAAISSDGQIIAAGSRDKNVYLFDAEGKLLSKYATGGPVRSVALSGDGAVLVAGSDDGTAYGFSVRQSAAGFAAQQQAQSLLMIAVPLAALVLIVLIVVFLRYVPIGQRFWARHGAGPRKLARDIWRARVSYLLLLPTVGLLVIFNYYPALSGLFHSFTDWKPGISAEWVGLRNFEAILYNEFLRIGIVNVIILIVTGYIKTLTMPLLVAELLFHLRSSRTQYWLRSLFIFPIVVPGVAIILIWRNILDPNIGLLNNVLALFGLVNMQQPQAWLGDPNTAIWSIVFIGFPFIGAFALLLYYGGLISIPTELFDAAKVDGAGALRRFFSIDLPLLMGQIKLLLILGFIGGMQEFSIVFLTTEGGPYNATYTPALELYYQAMRFSNFGVASAIGTVLFIVILGGTILNMRMRSATEYQA